MKCPKCQIENPDTKQFCGDCGTRLVPSGEVISSPTKTLETPVDELTRGTLFAERYEVIEELGEGGMGKVYRVEDTKIKEEIALKLIKPEIATDKKTIERFRNELTTARKISHRNVCRMFDLGEEKDAHYITMEYVPGEDLKSFIRRAKRLDSGTAISIAKQVCEGLTEAHRLGVAHRDLKPSNIMIDKEGNARIMDFGIARSLETKGITGAGVMIGTPEYMSPEQAEAKEIDQRTDIYSLGVILYEMVTGQLPFEGDTPLAVAMKHKGEIPKSPKNLNPQIPDDLSRVILKCLEKDKDTRYQSAGGVRSELSNIEKGIPTTEREAPERKPLTSKEITVTFGLRKLFIPILVLIAIVVVIALWHPWSKEQAIPIQSDKPSLAILYFENLSGDKNLDGWSTGFSDLLITDLMQSRFLNVLPGNTVFSILKKRDLLDAKKYTTEDLVEVANEGRVNHTVSGSYIKAGDNIIITLILQKPHTGEVVNSIKVECRGEEEIAPKVDELSSQIKRDLNLTQAQIINDIDKAVGEITTSSPEALKYYIEGLRLYTQSKWRESIQSFERAVSIDPDFASAYRKMAMAFFSLKSYAKQEEYLTKAFELRDRISHRERYQIEADFYVLTWDTFDKAIDAFNNKLELYPDDSWANGNLARLYGIIEEWDKAIEQYRINIDNRILSPVSYVNSAGYYSAMGMYDKAREVCELYLNDISDYPLIRWKLAVIYIDQGKYNLAHIELDKAFSLNPSWLRLIYCRGDIFHCQGDFLNAEKKYRKLLAHKEETANIRGRERLVYLNVARGKFAEAERNAKKGIELAEKLNDVEWQSDLHYPFAYAYISSNQLEKALEESEKALRKGFESGDFNSLRRAFRAKCMSLIEMGSLDEAQKIANELKVQIDKGMNRKVIREYYHLLGRIELGRNNYSQAFDYFEQAISLLIANSNYRSLYLDPFALAYFKSGDMDRAEEWYQKIIALPTGRILYGDIYAKSFYMLGKIYEQQGDTAKAIEHYEKFLDLWKDADPGIAEVEDTRRRVAGLKGQ